MATIDEIKQQAEAVKNATQVGENTAMRVGGALSGLADIAKQQEDNIGKKVDKAVMDDALGKKVDRNYVAKTNAVQDAEISRKANKQDVERSLNILRKEIGDRTVVEGDVNNNPDEEDLTSKMDSSSRAVLSLKDREYNPLEFSGKGYKILRKNLQEVTCAITKIQVTKAPATDGYVSIIINGVETHVDLVASTDNTVALVAKKIADRLSKTMDEYVTSIDGALVTCTRRFGGDVTASSFSGVSTESEATVSESSKTELRNLITAIMLSEANTIYEIRYDFDLDGKTLEVPENCTLKFEGGSLMNGTIKGNKTGICASLDRIFRNVHFANKWVITRIYPQWFGALADGYHDDTKAIQEALDFQFVLANAYILSNSYTGGSTYTTSIPCVFFTQGTYNIDKLNVYSYVYLDGNNGLLKSENPNDFILGPVERKFTNIAGWRCEIRNLIFSCKKAIMLNSRTESTNLDQGFARIEHCQFFGVDEICDVDLQSVLFIITNCILSKFKKLTVRSCDRFILSNNWIYAATNSINDYESFFYLFSAQSVIENNLFVPSYQEGKKEIAWFEIQNNRYSIFTGNRFGGEPGSFSLVNCKGENPFKYGHGLDSNLIIQNNQIYTTNGANTSCIIRIFNDFIRNIDVSGNTGCIDTSYLLLPSSTFDYQSKLKELSANSHLCDLKFNLGANNFYFSRENLISNNEISMIFKSEFGKIVRSRNIDIFLEEKDGKKILIIPASLLVLSFRYTSLYRVKFKFDCALIKNGFCQHISNYIYLYNYFNEDTDQAQIIKVGFTNNIFEKLNVNGVSLTKVWMRYNDDKGWCESTYASDTNVQRLTHLGIEFNTDADNILDFSIEKMSFSSSVNL